jgi:NAD(P)H-nitrite reductase large subunit
MTDKARYSTPRSVRGENDLIICRCEEVTRGEILQASAEGAQTLIEIKWRTRAGMGLCQSKTCRRLVSQILAEQTGQTMAEISPATHRPPVRPVELGVMAGVDCSCDPQPRKEK